MEIGSLFIKLGVNMGNFKAAMAEASTKIQNMSGQAQSSLGPAMDRIGGALKVVGVAAAAGFGAAAVASVRGASSLEQYRNTLNVVMKDQQKAAETMAWAVDFANRTPYETDSVVQATVRLQAYGLEAQKVLPAIGDMAAVMNKDIIQAVEAVADAQTGELERLKEFGITKQMIVDEGNRIMRGKELVNNQGQIVDQGNFNKALFSLMNERFKGGMEIQANSFKGLWSTVTGTVKTALATMAGISATGEIAAGGFFDKLKTKTKELVDKLNELQKSGQLQAWADKMGQALKAFWGAAEKIFAALVAAGKFVVDNWKVIAPILAGVLGGFMAFKAVTGVLNAVKAAQAALNIVMAANPIGLVVLAIAGLITAGVALYQNWDKVEYYALQAWSAIKQTILGNIGLMLKGLEQLLGWIPGFGDKIREAGAKVEAALNMETSIHSAREFVYETIKAGQAEDDLKDTTSDLTKTLGGMGDQAKIAGDKSKEAAEKAKTAWIGTADAARNALGIIKTTHETETVYAEMRSNKIDQLKLKEQQLNEEWTKQQEVIGKVREEIEANTLAGIREGETKEDLAKRTDELDKTLADEINTLAGIEKQLYDTRKAHRDLTQTLRDLSDEVATAKNKFSKDMAEALDEYQKKVKETNDKLIADEQRVTDEYNRAVDQRAEALANFVGLFDAVTPKEVSGTQLLENLRGQVSTFEDWSANIQALAARGVDEGLIAELKEMGPKAAPEIAALNTLTDTQLQEYVSLWRTKNEEARTEAVFQLQQQRIEMEQKITEIRAAAAIQLELLRIEWQKKNAEIRKNAEDELNRISSKFNETAKAGTQYGAALILNFAKGMESQFDYLQEQIDRALAMTQAIDPTVSHSPSLVDRVRTGLKDIFDSYKSFSFNLNSIAGRMAVPPPAALPLAAAPPMATKSDSGANYGGGNNIYVTIQGLNAEEIYDNLHRRLVRAGVRFG